MFKEILILVVAVVALTIAYPGNDAPRPEDQEVGAQTHSLEDESLKTEESAHPGYGGFYGGYYPRYFGYYGYPRYGYPRYGYDYPGYGFGIRKYWGWGY